MIHLLLLSLHVSHVASQFSQCPASCIATTADGTVYDLSGLKGQTIKTVDKADAGNTYSLTLCGQDPTSCPEDQSGVFNGMAVQTQSGGCYVLAVFGTSQQCTWDNTQITNGLTLSMSDGTSTYCGSPRTLQVLLVFCSLLFPFLIWFFFLFSFF